MRSLLITCSVTCLMFAVAGVEAAVITDAARIFGNTPGDPEIVVGPGGLQEGSLAFVDQRSQYPVDQRNYHWENIPDELLGADYVMTYNVDKDANHVSYSVTLSQAAMLYIFIDHRYVSAHGDPPFSWLTDGSCGAVFADTGQDIKLDEVGGRNVLQPFHIYGATVPAGTYTPGAASDGQGGRNFYAIAAVARSLITSAERIGGVTSGQPEIVFGPDPGGLQEGSHAFVDRPLYEGDARNYHWQDIPDELLGADYVKTYNDDGMPWDSYDDRPWPNDPYELLYSVTLRQAARLYLFIDRRYVFAHGDSPFSWLTDGSCGAVFADTGLDITLDELGGRNVLQPFHIYGATVPAGTYTVGPTCDGDANRNFCAIAAVIGSEFEGFEDFETGDFSASGWDTYGAGLWEVTSTEANSGTYSVRAGNILDDEHSILALTRECAAGDIGFFVKTSSESIWDKLIFTIDIQRVDEWSGELDWTEVLYPVTAGTHTFRWTYVKDDYLDQGHDTAWLDDVSFTAR